MVVQKVKFNKMDSKITSAIKDWDNSHPKHNKFTLNEKQFLNQLLTSPVDSERRYPTHAYRATHPGSTPQSARIQSSKLMKKPKIQETIEKILSDEGITKASTIRQHADLIKGAEKKGQYASAISGNRDFLKVTGVLSDDKNLNINHKIEIEHIETLSGRELDNALSEMLGADIIEGEWEDVDDETGTDLELLEAGQTL
jgi:hypothetical protein